MLPDESRGQLNVRLIFTSIYQTALWCATVHGSVREPLPKITHLTRWDNNHWQLPHKRGSGKECGIDKLLPAGRIQEGPKRGRRPAHNMYYHPPRKLCAGDPACLRGAHATGKYPD